MVRAWTKEEKVPRMANFYSDVIRKDVRFASLKPIHDLALLEPVTRSKVLAIIADAAAAGIKLMAYETYRSQARQTRLYHQRATKLKNRGRASLRARLRPGQRRRRRALVERRFRFSRQARQETQADLGRRLGKPGTRHKFVDSVHVQRCAISRQKALFAGTWYPDQDYDPYA
jgi:hypothetical protein